MLSPTGMTHSDRSMAVTSANRPWQAVEAHMRSIVAWSGMLAAVNT
jgi:hypothetical protein